MATSNDQLGAISASLPQQVSANMEALSVKRKWIILLTIALVTAVEIANRLSVNVLLPDMQGNVAANSDEISWVLTLYNIGFICSMALSAGTRRFLGARRHFIASMALYSVGAIGCFLSEHSLTLLLISRVIMGFGGGAFLVRFVVVAFAFFPGPAGRRPMTFALCILFGMQIVYPTLMGMINDAFHWNYAFLLDFPCLAIGAYSVWKYMPPGHMFVQEKGLRFDYRGAAFLVICMFALQAALSRGEQEMWLQSRWIVACLVTSIVSAILFLVWELHPRNDQPVLNLRKILETRSLRASFALVVVLGALMGTSLFILPQYLRNVQNFSATQTGEFFSLYAAGLFIGGLLVLRVILPRFGGLSTTLFGLFLTAFIFFASLNLWTPDTPTYVLVMICFAQGFAIGPLWFGVSNMAIGQIDLPHVSEGEATYFFVRQLGNSFGVSAATVLLDRRLNFHSARLLDEANRLKPIVPRYLADFAANIAKNGGPGSDPSAGALQIFQGLIVVQSRLLSFVDISFCLGILSLFGVFLALRCRGKINKALHFLHIW